MRWQQYEAAAEDDMLGWAIVFFIVALVAAVFGFSGISAGAAPLAQMLFFVCLVLFLVLLIARMRTEEADGDA